jgi:hypothetical protein
MGGRVTAIEGVPGDPDIYYVAGADGGLFKTPNGGVTFTPLFTDQAVYSVGAVALAPSGHHGHHPHVSAGRPSDDSVARRTASVARGRVVSAGSRGSGIR